MAVTKKILLIDDEPDFVEMMQLRLQSQNLEVAVAFDGEQGLAKALEEKPGVILLDVMMPGMDGLQVLRKLRRNRQTRAIPVIMLTAKGETANIFKAQDMGATEYVVKPCDSQELISLIHKYMPRRR